MNPVGPRTKAFNPNYVPGGGDKPIERRKLSWTSKAKIGSLEKANHRPGGGQVLLVGPFDKALQNPLNYWNATGNLLTVSQNWMEIIANYVGLLGRKEKKESHLEYDNERWRKLSETFCSGED